MPIKVYDTNEEGIAAVRRRRTIAKVLQVLLMLALSLGGVYVFYRLVLSPAQAQPVAAELSAKWRPERPVVPAVTQSVPSPRYCRPVEV